MANAQIFDSEQNPPAIKWVQINTKNFQLVYPTEFESEAQRLANTLELLIRQLGKSLNKDPRKITIILQNQGVISNGFVQLAPRRSELFTTPSQNFDVQDWLNSLAVHELRHVVQFDKLTGELKAPLFEELALAIFGITLPPWFFEGDAVGTETTLSHAGRGRLPDWELIFRTNTLSAHRFSYSKNYLGSFKDLTPGYYQLGYFMTSKLRRDYGKGIIDSIMTRISRNPARPYNLSNSIKKFTGLNSRNLHDSTINELDQLWKAQNSISNTAEYKAINKRNSTAPSDYLLPVRISANEIVALKSGLDRTPAFIRIDSSGKESKILNIGMQTEHNFTYSSGKLVWDEFRYDPRYQKRSFNVINVYDLKKEKYKQLTYKSRLFSPALSPDGKTIAAIKIDLANNIKLVEINSETGAEIRTFSNPFNYILQTPSYNKNGTKIICVAVNKDGAALLEFENKDGTSNIIFPFQRQQIFRPVYAGERILFRANYNGINNLYSYEPGHNTTQLTKAVYGASNPFYSEADNSVLFNTYQVKGYDISTQPLNISSETPISAIKNTFIDYAAPLVAQESASIVFDSVPANKYFTKPYREFQNLFYFHSLSPIAAQNDQNDLNIGLKLRSNNKLNTLDFYTGYQYNYGLKKSEYLAGFTYKRFYPVLDVKYINRAQLSFARIITGNNTIYIPINWRENFWEMELSVPFISNYLNQTLTMGLTGSSSYTMRYRINDRPLNFIDKIKFPVKYEFYLNHNTQRSIRDLAPRWGQNLLIFYQSLPFDKNLAGSILGFQTSFFTPGLAVNHSLQTSFNYQKTSGIYEFNIDIPRVSGYNNLRPVPVRNTLLMDYRFPLFYPDVEIGPVAYIKRIRGGLFADFENIGKENAFKPRTYGVELNADMNLLRFYLPDFAISGKLIFVNEKSSKAPIAELGFSYGF